MVAKRNTRQINREVRHLMYWENARTSIWDIYPWMEIYWLTKWQFSIINIIEEILKQTWTADVLISTWTAADAEIKKAEDFLQNNLINKLNFIVDRSFQTRQPKYYNLLQERFWNCIYTTNSHAKFVLISNNDWKITVRTSMNLNENKRLESFEVSDCPILFEYLSQVSCDIMKVEYSHFNFQQLWEDEKYKKYQPQESFKFDVWEFKL